MTEQIDITDLRAKLKGRTPGTWSVNIHHAARHTAEFRAPDPFNGFMLVAAHTNDADPELIVAAVNALPALLDEIERLRGERDDAESRAVAAEMNLREMTMRAGRFQEAAFGAEAARQAGGDQ